MSEKIEISFDDEKPDSKKEKEKEKIVIEFDDKKEEPEMIKEISEEEPEKIEDVKKSITDEIRNSKISSFYKGNTALTGFYESDLKFPGGIEKGFRRRYSVDLKDTFFNSVLESNKYIILSSRTGSIYFVDRFTGDVEEKIVLENEIFEKTGLVYKNTVYINSLNSVYKFEDDPDDSGISTIAVYETPANYYIWSNLNLCKGNLVFIEYNNSNAKANLKVINPDTLNTVYDLQFEIEKYVSDQVIVTRRFIFFLCDNKLVKIDTESFTSENIPLFFKANDESKIFYINGKVYLINPKNELYYIDLRSRSLDLKYTGIKSNYINSVAGFDDNIFIGTVYGWKLFKSNSMLLYSCEDIDENKIESVSKNILIVSKENKVVCHNLNKFQEAEGFAVTSREGDMDSEVIESVIISFNDFFVLTKSGKLEAFTNDKINIHV